MNDDPRLKRVLADWRVETLPEPGFQRAVWNRIEASSRPPGVFSALAGWLVFSLPRPLYASALVTLFALTGLVFADVNAARLHRHERARQEQRYMASIDPLSMMDQAPDSGR